MNPYYEHAGVTIYHGDCREILPQLPRVQCVVTSPPYNTLPKNNKPGHAHLHECIYHDGPYQCIGKCEKIPDWTGKRMVVEPYGVCPQCRQKWGPPL